MDVKNLFAHFRWINAWKCRAAKTLAAVLFCAAGITVPLHAQVTQPIIATNDNYSVGENTPLNVAAPGVLANDSGGAGP